MSPKFTPKNTQQAKQTSPASSLLRSVHRDKSSRFSTVGQFFTRKRLVLCLIVFVLTSAVVSGYLLLYRQPQPIERPSQVAVVKKETPALTPSPLTGLGVSAEEAATPPVAVVIENLYPDARPQAGLASAGIVYEVLAEGGITRHLAIYQKLPADIGPVRSLRPYFAYWGVEYNAPVVHAGGSAEALALVGTLNMKNLDQFSNGSYFRRISSRAAPHNLFIYGDKLAQLTQARGYNTAPNFTPWLRKDDAKSAQPTAATITLNFSSYDYQAKFSYNPSTNDYTRYVRGAAAIDQNGSQPIHPKVVVVMQLAMELSAHSASAQMIGSGQAWVFQDGTVTPVRWQKTAATQRTKLIDASGNQIALNRGQTWFSILPTGKNPDFN